MKRKIAVLILASLVFNSAIFAQKTRELTQEEEDNKKASPKRVALVIGNGAYTKAKPLPNPSNDAADMAKTLRELGFEVISGVNQTKRQTETMIREFGAKLAASGGVGLFYYAGHGIQVGGENYIVPVDADIPVEDEVAYLAVPISLVLSKMMTAKNDLNIVILDACRNNPFARSWRSFRDSSNNDGLAKISPPTGTLVLYATEPGKVASDGAGRNGLFTEALLTQIKRPDLEYDQMVKAVSTEVWQKSNKQQLPWKEGNNLQDFYFVKTQQKNDGLTSSTTPDKSVVTESGSANRVSVDNFTKWDDMLRRRDTRIIRETTEELVKNPQNVIALRMRSSGFFINNDSEQGSKDAREVENLLTSPKTAQEFEAKCYAQRRIEKYEEALNNCNQAINLNNSFAQAYYNRGRIYFDRKQFDKALADLNKAIELDSKFVDAITSRGDVFINLQMFEKALQNFKTVIELSPNHSYGLKQLGYLSYESKDYETAISYYSRAIEIEPKDKWFYYGRGVAYRMSSKSDMAIADLTNAIGIDPNFVEAYNSRGNSYFNKRDYERAIADFTKAIEINPKFVFAYKNRASVYQTKGEIKLAQADLQKAAELEKPQQ